MQGTCTRYISHAAIFVSNMPISQQADRLYDSHSVGSIKTFVYIFGAADIGTFQGCHAAPLQRC
jgi:hypothetical protein